MSRFYTPSNQNPILSAPDISSTPTQRTSQNSSSSSSSSSNSAREFERMNGNNSKDSNLAYLKQSGNMSRSNRRPSQRERKQQQQQVRKQGSAASLLSLGLSEGAQEDAFGGSSQGSGDQLNDTIAASPGSVGGSGGSVRGKNKRGEMISLNHLMNFQFPPRQSPTAPTPLRKRKGQYQSFNKERFINANFRFVMKENGDYTRSMYDPDVIVDWSDVLQVLIPTSTPPTCPICLSPPLAPRITKCGHVYCYPCLLHLFMLRGGSRGECPVCLEGVDVRDARGARFLSLEDIDVTGQQKQQYFGKGKSSTCGKKLKMVLMKRSVGSTVALPISFYSQWDPSGDANSKSTIAASPIPASTPTGGKLKPPRINQKDLFPFAKLLLCTERYRRKNILEPDLNALRGALKGAQAEEELLRVVLESKRAAPAAGAGTGPAIVSAFGNVGVSLEAELQGGSEKPFIEMALAEVEKALQGAEGWGETDEDSSEEDDVVFERKGGKGKEEESGVEEASVTGKREWNLDVGKEVVEDVWDEDGRVKPSSVSASTSAPTTSTTTSTTVGSDQVTVASSATPSDTSKSQPENAASTDGPPTDGFYYFYQSRDGQLHYLHPLDVKIIKHEYKTYQNFPHSLSVPPHHIQESTMTMDLRKRFRYLSHLPLSCDVGFWEVDLAAVVSKETLKVFEKELGERKRGRERKQKKEEAEERRRKQDAAAASSGAGGGRETWINAYGYEQLVGSGNPNEIASSWEDPSLFDTMFPAASSSASGGSMVNPISLHLNPDHNMTSSSSSDDEGGPGSGETSTYNSPFKTPQKSKPPYVPAPTTSSSFARIAASTSGQPLKFTPNKKNGGGGAWGSGRAGGGEMYDEDGYIVEGFDSWALDLEEAMCRNEDDGGGVLEAGSGSGKKKGKSGSAGKKGGKVLLVTNGGRRGGRY
ncbi:RING finger protein 10 [Chytridiales sp. JEL 0842]|nr:RING finger protein 10 [Chytridiales sp. JEL 0842]